VRDAISKLDNRLIVVHGVIKHEVRDDKQNLPGGNSAVVPPDPMPNSEVKRRSADGSVGSPHVRVGNCQASNSEEAHPDGWAFLRL
jgi:hypothetical protein